MNSLRVLFHVPNRRLTLSGAAAEERIEALARYAITTEQVLVSRGADEGIEPADRAFCSPAKTRRALTAANDGMYTLSQRSSVDMPACRYAG